MADLISNPSWDPVPQLETSTPALGGPGGPMNSQAQALLNRTEFLNKEVQILRGGYIDATRYNVVADDPTQSYLSAIIEALQAGRDQGKEVVLPRGRIRVDGQVPLYANSPVIGRNGLSILDFSNSVISAGTPFIMVAGSLAAGSLTAAEVPKLTASVPSVAHGLAVGDWFRIVSTVDANSSAAGEDRLGDRADVVPITETHQVYSVTDADNFQIRGRFRFGYPAGSAIRKITPVENVKLRELMIDQGSKDNRALVAELCRNFRMEDVEVLRAGGAIGIRGCFDGTRVDRLISRGVPATDPATNRQMLQIIDGSVGVVVNEPHLANGGQMIDVTYTASSPLRAPTLDTTIRGGTIRNASLSAVTDHPTCDGTTVEGVTMQDVEGAVYIRSRNATVRGVKAWGTKSDSSSIGVWAGENGYWRGLRLSDCQMVGFDTGYLFAGTGDTIVRRDMGLSNNRSSQCRIGEYYGNCNAGSDCGIRSSGSQHDQVGETGVYINGSNIGIDISGFQVRGPLTNAAIEIAGDLEDASLSGEVIDIGSAIPAVKVSSGAPVRNNIDIRRRGSVGSNSGLTRSMVITTPRSIGSVATSTTSTGNTNENTLLTSFAKLPVGSFGETGSLRVTVRGSVSGTAGTKTIRLRAGSGLLGSVALPAAASSNFVAEFVVEGQGSASQIVFTRFEADGVTVPDPSSVNRAVNIAPGLGLNISTQLGSATDSVTIIAAEAIASWA